MDLYYINNENKVLDFTKFPYLVNDMGGLTDFGHSYSIENRRIAFGNEPAEITLTLNISAETPEEYKKVVDYFFEVAEQDVLNNVRGRLYYGEQYVECNLVGSQKKDWCMGVCFMLNSIRFVTPRPYWTKETEYIFKASDTTSTNNKRYSNRYANRYANGLTNASLQNDNFAESNFKMIVYGPVVKPLVIVGGYKYYVDVVLEDGEYLEIDSAAGTIFKAMATGIRVNCFHNRGLVDSVFRPIQSGRQEIDWSGKFDFDIILYEERSQPRWQ